MLRIPCIVVAILIAGEADWPGNETAAAEPDGILVYKTTKQPKVSIGYLPGKPTAKNGMPPTAFDITARKAADHIKMSVEKGGAVIDISSPGGIGGATVTATGGAWPTTVTLRLHLRGLESISVSNGKLKLTGSVLSHSGNPRLLAVVDNGKEKNVDKESPFWTDIRVLDAGGKPAPGLPGKDGYFEITLPKALLESQPKSLELAWIDFYRG